MYALVVDGTIQSMGPLPNAARRLDTGEWVLGLTDAPPGLVAATGWYEVAEPAPPASTGGVIESTVAVVNGTPTRVWTERPKTPDEVAATQRQTNDVTIRQQLVAAMDALAATIATPPANVAQCSQKIVQNARVLRGLIRLQLQLLEGAD